MRARTLLAFSLLALPCALSAQLRRRPVTDPQTPQPAPLPPAAPRVEQALALKRSRWSAEGYSLISTVQVPGASGGVTTFATYGTGTHAGYRYTEKFSGTLDLTISPIGGSATSETAEVGTRYAPLSPDRMARPFFDLRAAYMHLNDTFTLPADIAGRAGGQSYAETGRYSRGFGAVAGTGVEFSLTNNFALSTELSALRDRMSTYRLTGAPNAQNPGGYWLTSFRYTVGLKYSPTRTIQ